MSATAEKRSFVRLPREQRMREIEAAARKVFARHGYDAAPINEIAGEAGVSEGTIYKFYTNKRDLLHTILKAWYQGMITEFKAKLEGVEGTRPRLRLVIWQHLKSIQESPDLCRLFYSEVRSAPDYYESDLYLLNREYTQVLMDILKTGRARGEIRDDVSLALVRDVVFGGVEHLVTGFLMNRGSFDREEVADQLSRMVFVGISAQLDALRDLDGLIGRLERAAERIDPDPGEDG